MQRRALFSLAIGALLAPELSEGDRLLIETTQLLGVVSGASDRVSLVQQYVAHRQLVTAYLERQYPGQTVDWTVIPAALKTP